MGNNQLKNVLCLQWTLAFWSKFVFILWHFQWKLDKNLKLHLFSSILIFPLTLSLLMYGKCIMTFVKLFQYVHTFLIESHQLHATDFKSKMKYSYKILIIQNQIEIEIFWYWYKLSDYWIWLKQLLLPSACAND